MCEWNRCCAVGVHSASVGAHAVCCLLWAVSHLVLRTPDVHSDGGMIDNVVWCG